MVLPMVDMELDDEEKMDAIRPIPTDTPDYPYGLRIVLTSVELEKLDLDPSDAFVGGWVHLHALAKITSVSLHQSEDGEDCNRVELQICQMAIDSEDEENEEY
jgi:hypothetical protein